MSWTLYRHFKGMHYLGIGTALHSESREPHTVYRCLYENDLAKLWIRPSSMFEGLGADGKRRFEPIARVRVVEPEDEPTVLAFGYDAWGEGSTLEEFVHSYTRNPNHLRGTRYLLESLDGTSLCNLNTLRFRSGLIGIASISTAPPHRRKGWASLLLRAVMEILRFHHGEALRFLLFSEVDPAMYEACGFASLPPELQRFPPSVAMATGPLPLLPAEAAFVESYF